MTKGLALILGFVFIAAAGASAARFIERELPCPVCGKVFYAKLDLSGSQGEMRLDLKPVGPEAGPWRLPDCPRCGFVIYKLPIPAAELAKCREIAASEEYKKDQARSTYFRVGLIYEKLGKSAFSVASSFLKASWQEEDEAARLKEDQELSLKYFTVCAQACGAEEKENSQLLIGELLRRLGRFEEARAHLAGLRGLKGFQKNFFADIVEYQLRLCSKLDPAPYEMADVREFKKPLLEKIKNKLNNIFRDLAGMAGYKTGGALPARKMYSPNVDAQ